MVAKGAFKTADKGGAVARELGTAFFTLRFHGQGHTKRLAHSSVMRDHPEDAQN